MLIYASLPKHVVGSGVLCYFKEDPKQGRETGMRMEEVYFHGFSTSHQHKGLAHTIFVLSKLDRSRMAVHGSSDSKLNRGRLFHWWYYFCVCRLSYLHMGM